MSLVNLRRSVHAHDRDDNLRELPRDIFIKACIRGIHAAANIRWYLRPNGRGGSMKYVWLLLLTGLLAGGTYFALAAAGDKSPEERRAAGDAAVTKGNFK